MHMYTVARLLGCRQFSDFLLFRGVLHCTYITKMERCKKDLILIEILPKNKERWDSVFRTGTLYRPDDPGAGFRWG